MEAINTAFKMAEKVDEMWISNLTTTITLRPYKMYNGRRKMMGITIVHLNFDVEEMDSLGAQDQHSSITSHPGLVTDVSALTGN